MTRVCEGCGSEFEGKRSSARFCGATCRQRSHRTPGELSKSGQLDQPAPPVEPSGSLVEATRKELKAAGRFDTLLGQQALHLAERLSYPDTGAATAALSKELRAVMVAALANAQQADDGLDELAKRRQRKVSGA